MAISQRKDGDVMVLEVSGPITIGQGDAAVREAIKGALTSGEKKVLLDLDAVTSLDSSGVGELISAHTSVAKRGGQLKLARLSSKVDSVLQVTRLSGVLDSYATQEDALVAFAQGR